MGGGGLHTFLPFVLHGYELSGSYADHFTPEERTHSTLLIGYWMGPRANLDAVGKGRMSCPCQESNHGPLIIHSIAWSLYWLIAEVTPWRSVFLEKLILSQPVMKFPALCRIQRFITVFAKPCHWLLCWSRWIQSTPPFYFFNITFWYYPPIYA
jgi:hypothetical protein